MKRLITLFPIYFFITLIWALYRFYFKFPEWVDEIIFKPLILLTPVFLYVKFKENRRFSSVGLTKINLKKALIFGLSFGLLFALSAFLALSLKNKGLILNPNKLTIFALLGYFFINLSTAISEESVFRGFILGRLVEIFKKERLANYLTSSLFTIFHLPFAIFVLKYQRNNLLIYLLSIFVLGFGSGFIYLKTRNIAAPIISHALWNFLVMLTYTPGV